MKDNVFSLGIDLGTTSCKICLLDKSGACVGSASEGYPTGAPHSGWAEQNPQDWLVALRQAARNLFARPEIKPAQVSCIVLTSAAHIGVLLDRADAPLRNALLWSDQRSKQEAAELDSANGEEIFRLSYNRASTSWTLPHLMWIKNHEPELWGSLARIALSKDYLLYHLTGEWATDPGTAVSAMLCNAGKLIWSSRLCGLVDIAPQCLPRIMGAGETVGGLSRKGASLLGLPQGVPVINGSLDSATETFGAMVINPGEYIIRIGTAGGIHVIKAEPRPQVKLLTYPYLIDGLWYSQAGTNSAGSAIAWALSAAGLEPGPKQFQKLDALASQAPAGCDGLLFHPYLSGERTPYWNSELRGTFSGLSFRHAKPHFARAVLEGVAFSLCDALTALAGEHEIPEAIKVVGGGAHDPVLMQILSSALNREIQADLSVDSSYGAAAFGLHCLAGGGSLRTREHGQRQSYRPDGQLVRMYEDVFGAYRQYARHLQRMYGDA